MEVHAAACPGCGVIMERQSVDSTNLVAVGWEPDEGSDAGTMEVEFKGGVVYQYAGVPQWVYQGLLFAPSPGRYLKASIVDSFEGQRIE